MNMYYKVLGSENSEKYNDPMNFSVKSYSRLVYTGSLPKKYHN